MSEEADREILGVLREIRDGQREMIVQLSAQRSLAEEQLHRSGTRIEESVGLQREALRRQRVVTLVAVPGVLVCVAAIAYLVVRYF